MTCLVLVFVHVPGLFEDSFIGDNSNNNIFTKNFNWNKQIAGNNCI